MENHSFGNASFHVMNDCPLVRSLGKIVQEGKPFIWIPGEMPFFGACKDAVQIAADATQIIPANRVEDGVPIFVESVNVPNQAYALAVGDADPEEEPPEVPPPPLPPPRGEGVHSSDADTEREDEDPLPCAERLQREARTIRHRMSHIPNNPYCDICRRARMYRRRTTRNVTIH